MDRMKIIQLARKGMLCEEPETKDAIFKAIISVAIEKDILDAELPKELDKQLPVELVLKENLYDQKDYVKLSEEAIKEAKNKFSTYKGYSKLQLALDSFQMSNDMFFVVYGFNYVPEGKVREVARKLIDSSNLMYITSTSSNVGMHKELIGLDMSNTSDIGITTNISTGSLIHGNLVKSIFKDISSNGGINASMMNETFKSGY